MKVFAALAPLDFQARRRNDPNFHVTFRADSLVLAGNNGVAIGLVVHALVVVALRSLSAFASFFVGRLFGSVADNISAALATHDAAAQAFGKLGIFDPGRSKVGQAVNLWNSSRLCFFHVTLIPVWNGRLEWNAPAPACRHGCLLVATYSAMLAEEMEVLMMMRYHLMRGLAVSWPRVRILNTRCHVVFIVAESAAFLRHGTRAQVIRT